MLIVNLKFPLAGDTYPRLLCFKEVVLDLNIPTLEAQMAQAIFTFEMNFFIM